MSVESKIVNVTKDDYDSYEGVRKYGSWNMLSPQARNATELDRDTYMTIIKHYEEIHKRFDIEKEEEPWVLT